MNMRITINAEPMSERLKYRDDYIGMKFGSLTVVAYPANNDGMRVGGCVCRCDCGAELVVHSAGVLFNGRCKCCRECAHRNLLEANKKRMREHPTKYSFGNFEFVGERLFHVWVSMRERCENPSNSSYSHYGKSGVSICDEWHNYKTFRDWAYSHGYDENAKKYECTIDRINPYGNYEPSNCRWANFTIQQHNKRSDWDRMDDEQRRAALATAGTYVKG